MNDTLFGRIGRELYRKIEEALNLQDMKNRDEASDASDIPKQTEAQPEPSQKEDAIPLIKKEEMMRTLMHILHDKAKEQLPAEGSCQPVAVVFNFPESNNQASLWLECDALDASNRRLLTRVFRKGTDLMVSHYWKKGSKDELMAYLADESHALELLGSLQELSDSVDEHW